MKKFKYPLAIKGTKEQLLTFFPLLEELGYKDDPSCGSSYKLNDCLYLITNFGAIVDSIGFNQSNDGQMEVSADNPELVLALAAAVEGDEFHEGEYAWWSGDQPRVVRIKGRCRAFPKDSYTDGVECPDSPGFCYSYSEINLRKLTKEEIINHFNMDTKCCGVSPQEKTYTVKESFVKAAHAQACSEWKQRIEKEFPEMFHLEYNEDKIYAFKSMKSTYKLHRIGYEYKEYAWISIRDSKCWANGGHETAEKALSCNEDIKVFNNEKEFANWILNN